MTLLTAESSSLSRALRPNPLSSSLPSFSLSVLTFTLSSLRRTLISPSSLT